MVSDLPCYKGLLVFFPLREVPNMKRDAIKLNHCLIQSSHFYVRDVFNVVAIDRYTAVNIHKIRPRLLWEEHILYIRAKMTSFFNIVD